MKGNPFDALAGPIRELHRIAGHEGQLINYSAPTGSPNDWLDSDSSADDFDPLDPEPLTIRVERSQEAFAARGSGGPEIAADVAIFVDSTTVSEIVEPGGDRPASVIIDPAGPTETRYQVVRVDDDGSGLWICQCERIDS